jgi:hypothetical protein
MTIQSFPPTTFPPIGDDHGYLQESIVVLGKLKSGEVYTVRATRYTDPDYQEEGISWVYTGRDGYTVGDNNLESWALIPEF